MGSSPPKIDDAETIQCAPASRAAGSVPGRDSPVDLDPDLVGQRQRRRATLSGVVGINDWPAKPGLTAMQLT